MFIDVAAAFSPFAPYGSPQTLAVTTSTASTNVYDVTGAGVGNTPSVTWGTSATFGADMGIGDGMALPSVRVVITTGLSTTNSATLNVALQSAPDDGTNNPGTWSTVVETGAYTTSELTANTVLRLPMAHRHSGQPLPRFYRLLYQLPASTAFSAGAVSAGIVIGDDSSVTIGKYPEAYSVV